MGAKKKPLYCESITPKYNYLDKERNVTDYVNYSLNRALAMFKYDGLPDTIPQNILEKMLLSGGFVVWAKVENDLYVFDAGLGGEPDVYGLPTQAIIANPALRYNATLTLDTDCVLMQSDSMCMGLLPLFNRYCTLINENDITLLLADVNKRVQFILSATDDNTADSARIFLDKIFEGKQGVITDNIIMQGLNVNPATTSQASIMDLVEYQQYLRAGLYNEIGLNSNFNMKREKLTATEVEMNSGNLYPLVDDMLNQRRLALEKVNKMFGTEITVDFASSWTMRAEINGDTNVDNSVENVENVEQEEPTTEQEEQQKEPTTEQEEQQEEPTTEQEEKDDETD